MLTNLALATLVAFAGPSASAPTVSAHLTGAADSDGVAAGSNTTPATDSISAASTDNVPAPKGLPESASPVKIKTKDKLLLAGSYYQPKRHRGGAAAPAVLLIHDAGQTRADLESTAVYLHKRGFAVLNVDLRGHGGSVTAETDFAKCDHKAQANLWALSTRDIDAAASFLLDQSGVHATNLSVVGVGAGAALAVRRATDDENVRAVVLVDPQAKAYGYNLATGIADLGGLPTMIITPKESRNVAERLQAVARDANGGLEYVELAMLKAKSGKALEDKRLRSATASWLRDQTMPRK